MRAWLLALFVLLLPRWAPAQVLVRGSLCDSLTQRPLPFANVFLLNTTFGTTTDAQGRYSLPAVPPGHYQLAATYLGYRLRQLPVEVTTGPRTLDFCLAPVAQALSEVVVQATATPAPDFPRFARLFLGTSAFAQQCRIRNPAAVQVAYTPRTQQLLAHTQAHPLIVENRALGYELTFYNLTFCATFTAETVLATTSSQVVFKELVGDKQARRRWAVNRVQAYRGSLLHFLRSTYAGQLTQQGFRLQRLLRLPNRDWARADSMLRAQQAIGKRVDQRTLSVADWRHLTEPHTRTIVYPAFLLPDSVRHVDVSGRVWLRCRDLLAVTYLGERPDAKFQAPGAVSGQRAPRYQESLVRLTSPPATQLAANGGLPQPLALVTEGYWSYEKIGELLPLDYVLPTDRE
jgi:hypothetical protein